MDDITEGNKTMIYTTRRLIAAIMERYDIDTKYGLAKIMGVSCQSAANWVDHDTVFNDKSALKAADLLELDYEYILICMQLERCGKNPRARKAWQHIADTWSESKVAVITLIASPLFASFFSTSGGLI